MGSGYSAALTVKGPQSRDTRRVLGLEHQQVTPRGKQSRGHREPLAFTSWCRTDPTGLTRCQLRAVGTFLGPKGIGDIMAGLAAAHCPFCGDKSKS